MILNYSSFMGLLKEHYLSTTTAEELARGLLEVVTGDTFNPNFVDSTYLSRIWNGEREIAKDIRDWLENADRKKQDVGTTNYYYYWLRSPYSGDSYHFCDVKSSGGYYYNNASNTSGVAPCFAI